MQGYLRALNVVAATTILCGIRQPIALYDARTAARFLERAALHVLAWRHSQRTKILHSEHCLRSLSSRPETAPGMETGSWSPRAPPERLT